MIEAADKKSRYDCQHGVAFWIGVTGIGDIDDLPLGMVKQRFDSEAKLREVGNEDEVINGVKPSERSVR